MPVTDLIPALIGSILGAAADTATQPAAVPVVSALPRAIPGDARIGQMQPPLAGTVVISGQTLALAPAVQIRDAQNHIVLPAYVQQAVVVRYQTDAAGALFRAWMLTPAEAAASLPR